MPRTLVPSYHIKFSEEEVTRATSLMIDEPFKTGMLCNSTLCRQLENTVKGHCAFKHAIATSTCSAALEIVFSYMKNVKGFTSITMQDLNFMTDLWAAENVGLDVYLTDIDWDGSAVMDGSDSIRLHTPIGGADTIPPCLFDSSVVDAAHMVSASYMAGCGVHHMGWFGGLAMIYSFGRIKSITGGTGGMILTNDNDLKQYARTMVEYGRIGREHKIRGGSFLMSEWNAAVAIASWEGFPKRRKHLMRLSSAYRDHIVSNHLKPLIKSTLFKGVLSVNNYRYYVTVPENYDMDYKGVYDEMLNSYGVQLPDREFPMALHEHSYFKDTYDNISNFPVTQHVIYNHICLPCHMGMTVADATYVANSVSKVLPNYIRRK